MRDRLLIVDDDVAVRSQMRWGLRDDFDIVEADTVADALERFREARTDVVMLDIHLSGPRCEAGFELIEKILAEDPLSKVIMVTGDADETSGTRAMELGAWDYYLKPIATEELRIIAARAARVRHLQGTARMAGPAHSIAPIDFEGWLGESTASKHVVRSLRTLAEGEGHVLIVGEPGTGRDLAARALHDLGPQSEGSFVRLLATEGLPEPSSLASAGTVFLDDVGSLPQADHGRLLEWIEQATTGTRVVISAGPELMERARRGLFPEAAYHFLATVTVHLPPLREHPDDLPRLARQLLRTFAGRFGAPAEGFTEEAENGLRRHRWPGNFRELERRVLGAVLVTQSRVITEDDIWPRPSTPPGGRLKESLADLERSLVEQALRDERGNVSRAARVLGVSRPSLHNLLRKHEIDPARYRAVDEE